MLPIYRRPVRSDFLPASFAALNTLRTDPWFALELWAYRAYGYLMVNVVEDPAWLALVFC